MAIGRTIQSTVSQDTLYLDATKAEATFEKIKGCLNSIANEFELSAKEIDKAGKTSGDIKKQFSKLSKSCKNQAQYTKKKCKAFESKFKADVQEYTIQMLSSRLTELEAKVAAFEKATEQPTQK